MHLRRLILQELFQYIMAAAVIDSLPHRFRKAAAPVLELAYLSRERAVMAEESKKWQGVVADLRGTVAEKDAALSEKDAALADQAALIAELRARLRL